MKFICPESQNRESLKCGNIASGSRLGGESGGSSAFGAAARWAESEAACACACAQQAGTAMPGKKANASAKASQVARLVRSAIMKMNVKLDRKSTRLNSSHANISYAVFC